jgi:hypothetical protein
LDAWGEPLQFFRWPIYYNDISPAGASGAGYNTQKGPQSYGGFSEQREVSPLDQNQTLVSYAWWLSASNGATAPGGIFGTYSPPNGAIPGPSCSPGATAFMLHFHSLLDPNFVGGSSNGAFWDRSGFSARRAFYSRFLILSGGPDKEPGVARLARDYTNLKLSYKNIGASTDTSGAPVAISSLSINLIEGQAASYDPNRTGGFFQVGVANQTSAALQISAQDDVSNHGLASPGGGIR